MERKEQQELTVFDVKHNLTNQLRKEIEQQGLTISDLAKKMNTGRMAVNRILNPNYPSSLTALIEISKVLGKSLDIRIS